MRVLAALFLILMLMLLPPGGGAAQGLQTFRAGHLEIESGSGRQAFAIELAETEEQQHQGLMYRTRLAPDAGMLFVEPAPQVVTMWMKNTLIPLDMVFIGADGRITGITERAVPESLEIISSGVPVRAVLELNGGTAARLGLKAGDRVVYPGLAQ